MPDRSIWNAKYLLTEGLIWRVGDGTKIRIWGDKWVKSTQSHLIQTANRLLHSNACVKELINQESN
jgi:hypothetical protein